MRVLYDHQAFTIQKYGGISRYFFELGSQFRRNPSIVVQSSLLFSNNEVIRGSDVFPSSAFFSGVHEFQKKIEAMNLINEMKSKWIFSLGDFDLFHPTYYDPYYLSMKSTKPVVITFHDLIHEKFKQYDHRTLRNKRNSLNRADKIIAVSQNSKNDLVEYYRIPEERVTVIHLASSIAAPECKNASPEEDYVLYVGTRSHYKNFLFFVEAIAPLLVSKPDLYLYCAGGGGFTDQEQKLFYELGIASQVKYCSGDDQSLTKAYSGALAFIFPSLYEGFGIPVLEAMNCGCPVGASGISSLPEVAGDAALYFDPSSMHSIRDAVESLASNAEIRSALRQKGFERAKHFSWEKTAEQTQRLYSSVA